MSFFSEEVESRCRISRTDLRRDEEKEEEQKKRTTRRRRNAVRSHIGSDTSNPEATPQIPPSCWTSCSLHNRIRMNRPSPLSFSSASSFSIMPPCLYSSRAFRARIPPSSSVASRFFLDALLALSSSPFSFFRLQIYPTTPSRLPFPSRGCSSRTTDTFRFFLLVVAETLRHRPRTKPPMLPSRLCSFLPLPSFGQSRFTTLH